MLYIIDFGGNLGKYASLRSVCACFDGSNEENIKRLFRTLDRRLKENADRLNNESFLSVYESAPSECPPHLTLIVDNTNAFASNDRYSAYMERIISYSRDGLSKGLTVILTANNISGMSKLISNCAVKIAFSMPEDNYGEIFGVRVVDKLIGTPGRGYIFMESKLCEYQNFLPFENERKELALYLEQQKGIANPGRLVSFPNVPLTARNLGDYALPQESAGTDGMRVTVGLDYYTHHPVELDLGRHRGIAISGKRGFGKTNVLKVIVDGIIRNRVSAGGVRFVCLDDGRKGLQEKELVELLAAEPGGKVGYAYFSDIKEFNLFTYSSGYGGIIFKSQQASSRKIRWNSDNPDIVSVDANTGDVTAKKPGEAIVRAVMGADGNEKSTQFKISIKDVELVRDTEKEMAVGDTQRFSAVDTRSAQPGRGFDPGNPMGLGNQLLNGAVTPTPFTVFIVQNQAIYSSLRSPETTNLKNWIQKSMSEAAERGYLFIFSDVGRISSELIDDFNALFSYHLILEDIADFAVRNGGKNVIGSKIEVKDLKAEYAPCDLGDGYSYDVESDELHKLRFIKYERD